MTSSKIGVCHSCNCSGTLTVLIALGCCEPALQFQRHDHLLQAAKIIARKIEMIIHCAGLEQKRIEVRKY